MNFTLTCPTCGAELEVEDVTPGTVIECPACNHALTVPEPPPARVVVRRDAPSAPAAPAPATQPIASQLRDSVTTIHRIIAGLVRGVVALIAIGLLVYYASNISRSAKETKPSAPAAAAAATPAPTTPIGGILKTRIFSRPNARPTMRPNSENRIGVGDDAK